MSLGARLEIRQGQGLVITPQLQQAIKLLQLSNLELESYLDAEMEKNPLLARDDGPAEGDAGEIASEPVGEGLSLDEAPGGTASAELDVAHEDLNPDASPGDRACGDAPALGAADGGGAVDWSRAGPGGSFEGGDEGERERAGQLTLADHIAGQIPRLRLSPSETLIAAALEDALDEGGYLRAEIAEVADRLGCAEALVETVLAKLQSLTPAGLFARSVPECLALQLKARDRFDPAMAALVAHLDLLARRDFVALRAVCGVVEEDLRDMIGELKALTPRPGAAFGGEPVQPVVPDVIVKEEGQGLWRVELNGDTLPRLLVDQRYHAKVARGARSDADRTFVTECLSQANWLVKSLDQRAKTILKVASEIVRQQDAFLAYGVEHLRPLNLKAVADAIGMHESTVSRVTSNKYVATPRGVFELKFFFTTALGASDGGASHSAEAVRHKIKALVDEERRSGCVLSDDRIVELLNQAGIDIARRTVAKYREALRIPASMERKRMLAPAG